MADELDRALADLTGRPDAAFRPGQREAISALVEGRDRVLLVQRTGWGKSAVYFITTALLRGRGAGPTLLISPLLALMRNQIAAAERMGLRCLTVNSASDTSVGELADALAADAVDLVLISPERLANPDFASRVMPLVGRRPGLLVIDEVHCISDWGHDFRPDYRRIGRVLRELGDASAVPVLGCTATANDRVIDDVEAQFGEALTFRGPLTRDGLSLHAVGLDRQAERLAWLADVVPELPGAGIIYCLTIGDAARVADWLMSRGIEAAAYTGQTDPAERLALEARLLDNELKALVATSALGMGYDKPDLGFVIHFQMPGSPVAYYQQVGRAGRALDESFGVLLRGDEDANIQDYFIESAFPPRERVEAVLDALDAAGAPLSVGRLQAAVNLPMGKLELVLKQLDVDGAVARTGASTYERTPAPYEYPAVRIADITAKRRAEQQAMVDYFSIGTCRMRYLAELLDDPHAADCGVCDNCTGGRLGSDPDPAAVADAEAFLRQQPVTIAPKKMAFDGDGKRRKIPPGEQAAVGRSLALLRDGGWGRVVRAGLAAGAFDDDLVEALAKLVADWPTDPAPRWVTTVPSQRKPELVESLGRRLADRLGLPYSPALALTRSITPQSEQENSVHQQANVADAFAVAGEVPDGPVLLVDDVVASGWTLTEAARTLGRADVPAVYPVTAASA